MISFQSDFRLLKVSDDWCGAFLLENGEFIWVLVKLNGFGCHRRLSDSDSLKPRAPKFYEPFERQKSLFAIKVVLKTKVYLTLEKAYPSLGNRTTG